MTTVTLEMPLPPVRCKPNEYCHWRSRGAAAKQYREEAFYIARQRRVEPFCGRVRISVDFYLGGKRGDGRYRPLDIGNAISSVKAMVDGIVDAGIIEDDNAKILSWGEVRLLADKADHGGKCGLVVTLEAVTC